MTDGSGGSCYMPIYARQPHFPGRRCAGLECVGAPSSYGAVFVIIPAAAEDPPFPPFLLFSLTSRTFSSDIGVYF